MKDLLRRIKDNLTASKLDLSIFISCILVAGLCVTLLVILLSRGRSVDNEVVIYETASPTDAPAIVETTIEETSGVLEETTYVYDIYEDGTEVTALEKLQTEISRVNNWTSGGDVCVQYKIDLTNVTDHVIPSWELVISFDTAVAVSDGWGGTFTVYGQRLDVKPAAYTEELQPGETKSLGMILSGEKLLHAVTCSVKAEGTSQVIRLSGDDSAATAEQGEATERREEQTTTGQKHSEETAAQTNDQQRPSAENSAQLTGSAAVTGSYADHGALHVSGTNLCDSQGNKFQLKGISTHGLNWYPQYINKEAFASLRGLGVNTIRLALYTSEYNGYCSGGDKTSLKKLVKQGVNLATEQGMYAVIDWHTLSDGNPNTYLSEALSFFDEMSAEFAASDNVLYEICNEPNGGTSWEQIKAYAEQVIDVIRKNDSDAVIIVGTPTWSQDVDTAAAAPFDSSKYSNIMYALHFYAATHTDSLRNKFISACSQGLPVFVSEFSICEASGNGRNDIESAQKWMDLLDSRGVSYIAWNLSNKAETSSLLESACTKTGGFSASDFSESGKWYLNQLN